MLTVRLPQALEDKLKQTAAAEKRTKTEVIRTALEAYLESQRSRRNAFDVGEDLFGRYGSGDGTLSTTYKRLLKERIRAKRTR